MGVCAWVRHVLVLIMWHTGRMVFGSEDQLWVELNLKSPQILVTPLRSISTIHLISCHLLLNPFFL